MDRLYIGVNHSCILCVLTLLRPKKIKIIDIRRIQNDVPMSTRRAYRNIVKAFVSAWTDDFEFHGLDVDIRCDFGVDGRRVEPAVTAVLIYAFGRFGSPAESIG